MGSAVVETYTNGQGLKSASISFLKTAKPGFVQIQRLQSNHSCTFMNMQPEQMLK